MNTSLYKVALSKSFSWDAAKQINALVGGTRGSGKSFFALGALVQLASFPRFDESKLLGIGTLPTQIFTIDFKNSDIARLGELLPKKRVAVNKKDAIAVLTHFDQLMHRRLKVIRDYSFGATASKLKMPLYYLIIDEWSATNAAFMSGMTKADKDLRYRWQALIQDISMLGRAAGFGLIVISQQISVTNSGISSAVQEEAGLKLHFGDAEMSSYRLTFGNEVQIPDVQLNVGEAFAWIEGVTSSGYVIPFAAPYVDAANIWNILTQALASQDDDYYLDYRLR